MPAVSEPLILERSQHSISRKDIDADALKVMYRLINHGHKAYMVGGGVRDLLLGKRPKDFDLGTDARPEVIRSIFRNSRIIGRRFKINHVYFFGNKIIEVATFRALIDHEEGEEEVGQVMSDNTYGDARSDAFRRDLTINGLFYDVSTFSVIDYVGGIEDLRNGIIRIIGEPVVRIKEDPVRMLRATRHAAKAGFAIEPITSAAIRDCASLIATASPARVHEELVREIRSGHAVDSFWLMLETGLLAYIMPSLGVAPESTESERSELWKRIEPVLRKIDRVAVAGVQAPESVLFAALFIERFPVITPEELLAAQNDAERAVAIDELTDRLRRVLGRPAESGGGGRRRRKQRAEIGGETRQINELFVTLGVSRKEREDMEAILEIRSLLLAGVARADLPRNQQSHRLLQSAALLIALTSGEIALDNVLAECAPRDSQSATPRPATLPRGKGRRRGRGNGKKRES